MYTLSLKKNSIKTYYGRELDGGSRIEEDDITSKEGGQSLPEKQDQSSENTEVLHPELNALLEKIRMGAANIFFNAGVYIGSSGRLRLENVSKNALTQVLEEHKDAVEDLLKMLKDEKETEE